MSNLNIANQYLQQGKFEQAAQIFQQLIQSDNSNVNAMFGLGKAAFALNNYKRSYDLFVRCLSINSTSAAIYLALADSCIKLNLIDKAEQAFLYAYKQNNGSVSTLVAIAAFYCESGNYPLANDYLLQLTAIEPHNINAFALLVRIHNVALIDSSMNDYCKHMFGLITSADKNITNQQHVLLHYSFAELFHRAGMFDKAFTQFKLANQLQLSKINFRVQDMAEYFTSLITTFTDGKTKLSSSQHSYDKEQPTPIFIVGQPRSGSTLLEQMLIAHTKVATGGELPFFADDIARGIRQLTGTHFPQGCPKLTADNCRVLAQHYLQQIQSLAPNAHYIIDKMPANYQSIGLIKQLMPHAKVIHISREPMAVGWSIYRNNFAAVEPYFCDLGEIKEYRGHYENVMALWNKEIPEFIHNISYEQLLENSEVEIKKVLDFIGLDYQADCLDIRDNKNHIATLSDVQLRQGIDKNHKSDWQHYQSFLQPLL
ncbi:sulfotransferase [Colwelliaceae bacterium BS250]